MSDVILSAEQVAFFRQAPVMRLRMNRITESHEALRAENAELRKRLEAAERLREAAEMLEADAVHVESTYANVWTTGAGWVLKRGITAVREALAMPGTTKQETAAGVELSEEQVLALFARRRRLTLATTRSLERTCLSLFSALRSKEGR